MVGVGVGFNASCYVRLKVTHSLAKASYFRAKRSSRWFMADKSSH